MFARTPLAPPPIPEYVLADLASMDLSISEASRSRFYANGWWRNTTVLEDFERSWRANPEKTAIVTYRAGSAEVHRLDYKTLAGRVERIAGALIHMGVRRGDVVSIQLPNWWQFVAIALATFRVGAVVNPIIPIHRSREVGFIAGLLETRVCFTARTFRGFDHARMMQDLEDKLPNLEHRVIVDFDKIPDSVSELSFERDILGHAWELDYQGELATRTLNADQISDIQFTSGTTGEPKGVGHTHNTQFARARSLYETLRLDSNDIVFMPSTLAHSTGFVYGFITSVMLGMTAIYQDVWDSERALEIIDKEAATWSFGSTAFVTDLIKAQRHHRRDLSRFRYFVSGGAAIPPAAVREAADVLSTRLMACWGMTENGGVTFTRPDDPLLAAAESDGHPAAWMELKVVDPLNGKELPVGSTGVLKVRGASQMIGYVKRPGLTQAATDQNGWFDTGDVAHLDALGNVRISGRVKDIIVRGGENVPVVEIETLLYRHPFVDEVAIVGYPDERLGERACAVVVAVEGTTPTLADLTAFLQAEGVSKTYWPERLELRSELPRTLSGKVQKFRLRKTPPPTRDNVGTR